MAVRAASRTSGRPLAMDRLSAQVQVGLDWQPLPSLLAHIHLLGRTDDRDALRGNAGIAEAYVEANVHPMQDRLRLRAGALFLPTSRENVDALWESPYTITSSALNSWFGEELRPIGVDATYTRGPVAAGATVFRGNDTCGALPVDRGWSLSDHWTVLGEHFPVAESYGSSVSAETDGRVGWSARAGWNGARFNVQATHIDNRSDGLEYGDLENWGTRFNIVAAEYATENWTVAGESGWGPSYVISEGFRFTADLDASYVLVSRRWDRARATVRVDSYRASTREQAITVAGFWSPRGSFRLGAEVVRAEDSTRAIVEVRYHFAR